MPETVKHAAFGGCSGLTLNWPGWITGFLKLRQLCRVLVVDLSD
jgi:hypothetical protein